jgi:hypothetical protein
MTSASTGGGAGQDGTRATGAAGPSEPVVCGEPSVSDEPSVSGEPRVSGEPGVSAEPPKPGEPRVPDREPVLPEQSREDTDIAWGDYSGRDDDRLYRDRPPHWADY